MSYAASVVGIEEQPGCDLRVDAIYSGGVAGNAGDDPLNRLLSVSVMGGFRYRGSIGALEMLALTSSLSDPDWPDALDEETGVFTYYGDNKHPGRALHTTPRRGNEILRDLFELAQGGLASREKMPPIFLFGSTGRGRDVAFLGLAVPGTVSLRPAEDLVAIWKIAEGKRFQNYRARLTILDAPVISREWIREIVARRPHLAHAPDAWRLWVETGRPRPLLATRSLEYRRKAEQLPADPEGRAIVELIHSHFAQDPHGFENCAAALCKLMLPDIAALDVTRPSRDGGRDAIGRLRLGVGPSSIMVEFAIEAKCYNVGSSVGVREVSRLISRLRHRQFGVLVTTSYLESQAYKEIKEDQHPIIVISASDIVAILRMNGRGDLNSIKGWLTSEFPSPLSGGA